VIGDEGRADPAHWRNHLSEALRLVAMELGTIAIERALKKLGVRADDRIAFFVGGTAETARQAVGLVLRKISPTTDAAKYGLNGLGQARPLQPGEGFQDAAGRTFVLGNDGQYYQLEGVMEQEEFSGVMDREEFAGRNAA
jgi:hypothetical protein